VATLKAGRHVLTRSHGSRRQTVRRDARGGEDRPKAKFMIAQMHPLLAELRLRQGRHRRQAVRPAQGPDLRRQRLCRTTPGTTGSSTRSSPAARPSTCTSTTRTTSSSCSASPRPSPRRATSDGRRGDRCTRCGSTRRALAVQLEGYWECRPASGSTWLHGRLREAAIVYDLSSSRPRTVFKWDGPPEVPALSKDDGYFIRDQILSWAGIEENKKPEDQHAAGKPRRRGHRAGEVKKRAGRRQAGGDPIAKRWSGRPASGRPIPAMMGVC